MFIELWQGLRDLMHDNATDQSASDAKRFINWTLKDLSNVYEWEFLRGTLQVTATGGSGLYDLNVIQQLSATAQALYFQIDASADAGSVVTVYGKQVPGSNANVIMTNDAVTMAAGATASGGTTFSHIDHIVKATTSGSVYVTTSASGGDVVAILGANDTYLSNDIQRITKVIDQTASSDVIRYDYNTYQKGNPNDSSLGSIEAYDIDFDQKLRLMNISGTPSILILYQRFPKYLMYDQDRTEFPYQFYNQIIDACYQGYGLRYQDESDAWNGKVRYKELLNQIVSEWLMGRDKKQARVIPSWYKQSI